MGITAIIMASGHSSRLGQDKLRLGFCGRPLLLHLLKKLDGLGFDEVLLVSAEEELLEMGRSHGATGVRNDHAKLGKSASIRAGVHAASAENDLMFFVADQPLLRPQSIRVMLEMRGRYADRVIVPSFAGEDGNPVIFPSAFRERLIMLSGDQGGKAALSPSDEVVHCHIADALEGADIDTREDYERLLLHGSKTVVVRGGGDVATGVVQKLWRGGFRPVVLESAAPTAIRRSVALSQAVYDGSAAVEDVGARLIGDVSEITDCFAAGFVPVMVDEKADSISGIGPVAVVDAIIAKRNLGTTRAMAPVTIGLGPGFTAGEGEAHVNVVIETMRGHDLGRLIYYGSALPNTGVPGEVGGVSRQRVIHSPTGGRLATVHVIGAMVSFGDTLAYIGSVPVLAPIDGLLRGMIRDGLLVRKGQKIADIDPREGERENWRTISDKARSIGGAVLEALLREIHIKQQGVSGE